MFQFLNYTKLELEKKFKNALKPSRDLAGSWTIEEFQKIGTRSASRWVFKQTQE